MISVEVFDGHWFNREAFSTLFVALWDVYEGFSRVTKGLAVCYDGLSSALVGLMGDFLATEFAVGAVAIFASGVFVEV